MIILALVNRGIDKIINIEVVITDQVNRFKLLIELWLIYKEKIDEIKLTALKIDEILFKWSDKI